MKKLIFVVIIIINVNTFCYGQNDKSLRKEFDILKSIVGKTWVSEEAGPGSQRTLYFIMKFDVMHNGKTIKRYFECKELNFQSDGYYFYDPDKKEIAMLELGSNGNYSIGNIIEENGVILKYGYTVFPDRKLKFRNTIKITPDGKLDDQFFSYEEGEWKPGHSRIFTAQ